MEYIKATEKDTENIVMLVQETIRTIYPKYYTKEVVDFFCELHCKEHIFKDIENGRVGILQNDGVIIGTGCIKDNHITRVYVKPAYQRQGYGSYIMQCLENEIGRKYNKVFLDASLPACRLYEKMGYKTLKHDICDVENDVVLVYEVMEKELSKGLTDDCDNKKSFVSIRKADTADYEHIRVLENLLFGLHCQNRSDYFRDEVDYSREEYEELLEESCPVAWIALDGEKIIGMCFGKIEDTSGNTYCKPRRIALIEDMFVLPEYRGKGVATALMEKVMEQAKEKAAVSLELCVWDFNENARQFYEKLGMKIQYDRLELDILH